jgi:hypothetical protein
VCVVVPRPPCQGDRPVPRGPPRARSSPLHCDQEPSRSVDHEQRAFAPLASTTRGLRAPGPRPVFRHRLRPKEDVGSPFGNSSTLSGTLGRAGSAARGTREEGRRADRLRCATWPARKEEHPSHTVPPSGCGMSFVRASGSPGFPPAALSRALCSGRRHHMPVRDQRFVKRWRRSCFRKPRAWRTCWGRHHREAPRTQPFCKTRAPNSLKSEPHFSRCLGGSLDSVRFATRRRTGPRHPLAQ